MSFNVCFMILDEKNFKKPILDEIGPKLRFYCKLDEKPELRIESWWRIDENTMEKPILKDLG